MCAQSGVRLHTDADRKYAVKAAASGALSRGKVIPLLYFDVHIFRGWQVLP